MKPYYDKDGIVIYNDRCERVLPFLEPVDLLLTDPPYGLGSKLTGGKLGEWSKGFETAPGWDIGTCPLWLLQQALLLGRHAIIWGGNYYDLPPARGWLGWDKMQDHSSGHYELAWTNLDIPTRMFRLSRVEAYSEMGKRHPTQKPVELMQWCLGFATDSNSVLDPFMGSGTTLVAAKLAGLRAIGIEQSEEYCEAAVKRLAQGVLPLAV